MKTKEYVTKYRLDQNDNFNHNEFVSDLTVDFMTLLEVGKSTENVKGFENAVRAIRQKWDGINKKTVGQLPEKLWKYFYATVIVKMKEELFPGYMKAQQEKRAYREDRRKREDAFWDNFFWGAMFSGISFSNKPTTSFKILGLSDSASKEDVKSAYRKLAHEYHPDKGGNQKVFVEITEAKNKCLAYLGDN